MTINVFLALRDDAQALIKERLNWDESTEYSGPVTNRQNKLFKLMQDRANRQKLFRIDEISTRSWTLWSLYFDFDKDIMQKIQAELDDLTTNFPNHVKIVGAWHWDGRQAGTQFVRDAEGNITGTSGSPTYPLHARLIQFMPDDVTYDENGNETSRTRPTVPSDVNLAMGQSPRRFT